MPFSAPHYLKMLKRDPSIPLFSMKIAATKLRLILNTVFCDRTYPTSTQQITLYFQTRYQMQLHRGIYSPHWFKQLS